MNPLKVSETLHRINTPQSIAPDDDISPSGTSETELLINPWKWIEPKHVINT